MPSQPTPQRFQQIYSKYYAGLRRFLSAHLTNAADVEDCTQEAFLNLWKKEEKGVLREDVGGYLFTTALNVLRDFGRKNRSRQTKYHVALSQVDESERNTVIDNDFNLRSRELLRLIEGELANMKPATRAVFLLYHAEHLESVEIAKRLGISVRTVEREMVRAVEHLQIALGGAWKDLLE